MPTPKPPKVQKHFEDIGMTNNTAFGVCPACSATVWVRVWHHSKGTEGPHWEDLVSPLTPFLGMPHQCNAS